MTFRRRTDPQPQVYSYRTASFKYRCYVVCGTTALHRQTSTAVQQFVFDVLNEVVVMYVAVRRTLFDLTPQVVVDSHIQRIVLATEETTVTQQVSHRPIKCQSCLWSQGGTKVNGSHHGDNPLLRPTGIQIATKSYAALQAM